MSNLTHLAGFIFHFKVRRVSALKILCIWYITAAAVQPEGELQLYYVSDEVETLSSRGALDLVVCHTAFKTYSIL